MQVELPIGRAERRAISYLATTRKSQGPGMGSVVQFPRRHARAASVDSDEDSGPIQSSADTSPEVNDLIASIVPQSGRTKRRRYRFTLTRERPMAAATSSSESSRVDMKSDRCMSPDVHPTH